MSNAQLYVEGPARLRLAGELTFESVPSLVGDIELQFDAGQPLELDLAAVSRSDSAGLALLVSWERRAKAHNSRIHYLNMPDQLRGLAQLSGVEELLCSTVAE